jgi:hypothetical protein
MSGWKRAQLPAGFHVSTTVDARLTSEAIRLAYDVLRRSSGDVAGWPNTSLGADLWVDGLDAIRSTSAADFSQTLESYQNYRQRVGLGEHVDLSRELAAFDVFIEACAARSELAFYQALCLGLSILHAAGGTPDVLVRPSDAVIVNDSVMYLLSPLYRAIRVSGYHAGAQAQVSVPASNDFRPAECFFSVPAYAVIELSPIRVQHYNVNHDLAHLGAFHDLYLHAVGDVDATALALTTAEETCCALDLWTFAEAARFGVRLHLLDEMERLQVAWQEAQPEGPLRRGSDSQPLRQRYRNGLMSVACGVLGHHDPSRWGPAPEDLHDWISAAAIAGHVSWCREQARLLTNPAFRRFAEVIAPDPLARRRIELASRPETVDVAHALFPEAESPDEHRRAAALVQQQIRGLVYRIAEANVVLDGDATTSLRQRWEDILRTLVAAPTGEALAAARTAVVHAARECLAPALMDRFESVMDR